MTWLYIRGGVMQARSVLGCDGGMNGLNGCWLRGGASDEVGGGRVVAPNLGVHPLPWVSAAARPTLSGVALSRAERPRCVV